MVVLASHPGSVRGKEAMVVLASHPGSVRGKEAMVVLASHPGSVRGKEAMVVLASHPGSVRGEEAMVVYDSLCVQYVCLYTVNVQCIREYGTLYTGTVSLAYIMKWSFMSNIETQEMYSNFLSMEVSCQEICV